MCTGRPRCFPVLEDGRKGDRGSVVRHVGDRQIVRVGRPEFKFSSVIDLYIFRKLLALSGVSFLDVSPDGSTVTLFKSGPAPFQVSVALYPKLYTRVHLTLLFSCGYPPFGCRLPDVPSSGVCGPQLSAPLAWGSASHRPSHHPGTCCVLTFLFPLSVGPGPAARQILPVPPHQLRLFLRSSLC